MIEPLLQAAYDKILEYQLRARPFQTPESIARAQQRERERQAKLEMEVGEAQRQWEAVFHLTNDVGKAALALHEPEPGDWEAVCGYCTDSYADSYGEVNKCEWPCATFLAVRDA